MSKKNSTRFPNIYHEKERGDKGINRTQNSKHLDNVTEKDITITINGQNRENQTDVHPTVFSSILDSPESHQNHSDTIDSHTSLGSRSSGDMDSKHQRQLTIMLLGVTTVFLVLTSPQYIRYIIFSFLNITRDEQTFAFATLFYHLTNKLFYTNSAVNFYLYCIAGSKFRTDVRLLWKRHFKKRKPSSSNE